MPGNIGKTRKVGSATGVSASRNLDAPSKVERVSFLDVLDQKDDERRKKNLDELLHHVDEKGKALSERRTVESLYEYKNMVKGFIEEAVEYGLKIDERRGFSKGGRSRVLKTVSAIDAKLLELTDIMIKQEEKNINILRKVGEIKGMLISLYL